MTICLVRLAHSSQSWQFIHAHTIPGAMVLAYSLRDNGTKKKLAVLVTLNCLQASTITELKVIPSLPVVWHRLIKQ